MLGFFRKKGEDTNIYAPIKGTSVLLEKVNDPIFAQKMMGDGIAIQPSDNVVCAPCDGTLTMIAQSAHAFGIIMDNGTQLLVHIGLDTVNLNGKYFHVLKQAGSRVTHGEAIIKADIAKIKACELDPITMVIITNHKPYHLAVAETKVNTNDIIMSL